MSETAQQIAREALEKTEHLYPLFREYGDDVEYSGRIGYALAADLIEYMRRIAALPVPSVPEVGSRWKRKDGTHHPRTVTQIIAGPLVSSRGERLEHMQSVESFLNDYTHAEGGADGKPE